MVGTNLPRNEAAIGLVVAVDWCPRPLGVRGRSDGCWVFAAARDSRLPPVCDRSVFAAARSSWLLVFAVPCCSRLLGLRSHLMSAAASCLRPLGLRGRQVFAVTRVCGCLVLMVAGWSLPLSVHSRWVFAAAWCSQLLGVRGHCVFAAVCSLRCWVLLCVVLLGAEYIIV